MSVAKHEWEAGERPAERDDDRQQAEAWGRGSNEPEENNDER